jgi:histone H3/H4
MAADRDSLRQLSDDDVARLIRSAVAELAGRGTTSAFQALIELSAYVGQSVGEAARRVAEGTSWSQVAEISGTSKQAAWSRWHWS